MITLQPSARLNKNDDIVQQLKQKTHVSNFVHLTNNTVAVNKHPYGDDDAKLTQNNANKHKLARNKCSPIVI